MQVKKLDLNNFRNYKTLSISFSEGVNIIYGENGQGKTNILESIYMCSTGKSHKGSKEKEIINKDSEEAHIKAEFAGDRGTRRIDIHLKKSKEKGIALNRVPIKKIKELYGKIFVVMFSTEDLDIIKRGPSDRRDFLDIELCQMDPVYVENLILYNKILKERRELFKKLEEPEKNIEMLRETLDIWDLQLVNYGTKIIERRQEFIKELNEIITDIHSGITSGKENLKISYEPSVNPEEFYEELLRNRERDSILKQTGVGPHRDDFSFFDGKTDMKVYGSNGQQRTCALSLKLSEIKMIESRSHEKPVLLLDDVLSELDRSRQKMLVKTFSDMQTIITCTGIDEFVEKEIKGAAKFHIKNGEIVNA